MVDTSLVHPTLEERIEARARILWRERQDDFVYLGDGAWEVPSQSVVGKTYLVLLRPERQCGCACFSYREDCAHVRAGRLAQIRTGNCDDCGERKPYRELVEVTEDHDSLTWFPGDLLCVAECAGNHGVL